MKKILISLVLVLGCMGCMQASDAVKPDKVIPDKVGDKMSCNERVQHGPRGIYKGILALGAAAVGGYILWDIAYRAPDLWVDPDHIHKDRLNRWPLSLTLLKDTLAATALGYIALKFGKESKKSLTIFYTDTE